MNTHLTGRCAYCGKPKFNHYGLISACDSMDYDGPTFYDSGQKALDDNAAELFEAVGKFKNAKRNEHLATRMSDSEMEAIEEMFSAYNKIKPK